MDEIIKRDENRVTVLAGVTNDADLDVTMFRVDPISKRLLVDLDSDDFDNQTLAEVSAFSTDTAKSTYTITSGVPVLFTSTVSADLILEADSDNSGEDDNPRFIALQDGGLVGTVMGNNGSTARYTDAIENASYIKSFNTIQANASVQIVTGTSEDTDGNAIATFVYTGGVAKVGVGTTDPQVPVHIDGGTDAALGDTTGYLVIGDVGGLNVVMDNNELLARNNGATSTFNFNPDGGGITFGANTQDSDVAINGNDFFVDGSTGFSGFGINSSLAGKVHIDNTADQIGLILQAHSTQTENVFEMRNNSGTVFSALDGLGNLSVGDEIPNVGGVILGGTARGIYVGGANNAKLFLDGLNTWLISSTSGGSFTYRNETGNVNAFEILSNGDFGFSMGSQYNSMSGLAKLNVNDNVSAGSKLNALNVHNLGTANVNTETGIGFRLRDNATTASNTNGTEMARIRVGTSDITSGTSTGTFTISTRISGTMTERVMITETGVGIGTSSPNASSITEMSSTTQGFLPPRMTTTQKNAISSPATGLVLYDTTLNKLCVYTGSAWETVTSA